MRVLSGTELVAKAAVSREPDAVRHFAGRRPHCVAVAAAKTLSCDRHLQTRPLPAAQRPTLVLCYVRYLHALIHSPPLELKPRRLALGVTMVGGIVAHSVTSNGCGRRRALGLAEDEIGRAAVVSVA